MCEKERETKFDFEFLKKKKRGIENEIKNDTHARTHAATERSDGLNKQQGGARVCYAISDFGGGGSEEEKKERVWASVSRQADTGLVVLVDGRGGEGRGEERSEEENTMERDANEWRIDDNEGKAGRWGECMFCGWNSTTMGYLD